MRKTHRLVATAVAVAASVAAATVLPAATGGDKAEAGLADEQVLREYAADTWQSMAAMADPGTGLVSDNVGGDLSADDRAEYTSPTNIGAYMWSAIAAREIGLISAAETRERIAVTLKTLARLRVHHDSGMFFNWYAPTTGKMLTKWPVDGGTVNPFLSSVDNAWLATGLELVIDQVPALADEAHEVLDPMDFGYYYNPAERQIRGGFWVKEIPGSIEGNYRGDKPVFYTGHHYGAFNTEPRMASYLGIASGQIPERHYFGSFRTFPIAGPDGCAWGWTEQRPVGENRTYTVDGENIEVFEGAYQYRDKKFVPTWGGSMFEALMVPLFVPEEEWGADSWARTHPTFVQAQIEHGLDEAAYGYWGFSPSNNPAGGYREYGVDQLGMNPDGYSSDVERTVVDEGYKANDGSDCRPAQPLPESYGQGVVTPHASFIAYRYAPEAALANLAKLRSDFDAYGPGGFYDAINVSDNGEVSRRYLSLDQGMVMAALGNALGDDVMRSPFAEEGSPMEERVAPLMRMEEFTGVTEGP